MPDLDGLEGDEEAVAAGVREAPDHGVDARLRGPPRRRAERREEGPPFDRKGVLEAVDARLLEGRRRRPERPLVGRRAKVQGEQLEAPEVGERGREALEAERQERLRLELPERREGPREATSAPSF